jgi:MoaA/NifB/PqqE/SkfB family radical SAM enzyme
MNNYALKRALNLGSATSGWLLSALTSVPFVYGMPPAVGLELTNFCNLSCPECVTGASALRRTMGFMETDLYEKILSELSPWLLNANLYFQGEPMLHPDFFKFLDAARGIRTTVSTNGHFLDMESAARIVASGLRVLIVSLDGTDADTYSVYRRGGDFNKVMEGLENVSKEKIRQGRGPDLRIQFLVGKHNEHQMEEVRLIAKKIEAQVVFKSMQVIGESGHDNWMPTDKHFRRYEETESGFQVRRTRHFVCKRAWMNPVVSCDGLVFPCCFDKNGDHIMGDIKIQTFREIWHGRRFYLFRKELLEGRKDIAICKNCIEGLKYGIR